MALEKKSGFSFDVESRFKDLTDNNANPSTGTVVDVYEDNHEDKDTPKFVQVNVSEPEQKERKVRKINFLTYESLDDRITAYAKKRGVKKVAVFEAAMTAYLDMVDPIEPKK